MPEPESKFSDETRALLKKQHIKKFEAVSIVEMTVDEAGMPQDICITKQAGFGLDKQAFVAVTKYRFQPATLNGKPVAVRLAVEVKFRRFDKQFCWKSIDDWLCGRFSSYWPFQFSRRYRAVNRQPDIDSEVPENVWSAARLQGEAWARRQVCANVFGL
jgi:Gram-negative bacterial TonB protein C-terminal